MLDPPGNEGLALSEYHRQERRLLEIDALRHPDNSETSPSHVHAVLPAISYMGPQIERKAALTAAELRAVLSTVLKKKRRFCCLQIRQLY
jgi:hypothetical protein